MSSFTREPSTSSLYPSTPKRTSSIVDTTATGAGNPSIHIPTGFFELLGVLAAQVLLLCVQNQAGKIASGVNRGSMSRNRTREQGGDRGYLCRRARVVCFETASRSNRKRWRRLEHQSDETSACSRVAATKCDGRIRRLRLVRLLPFL